ncbi:MAG: hypothetical protein K0Q49_2060 [Haloplasmataceae bacterium]|jgi:predicted membrane protein|nr:hypothetical protein [Haloplasmataceae bacterium]
MNKPKIHKIILTGYLTFSTLMGSILGMILIGYFYFYRGNNLYAFFGVLGFAVIALVYFVYRITYLFKLLSTGIECPAIIRNFGFIKIEVELILLTLMRVEFIQPVIQ